MMPEVSQLLAARGCPGNVEKGFFLVSSENLTGFFSNSSSFHLPFSRQSHTAPVGQIDDASVVTATAFYLRSNVICTFSPR